MMNNGLLKYFLCKLNGSSVAGKSIQPLQAV